MSSPDQRAVFYAGSFDPVTNGHLDIISRARTLFPRVVIGVGNHHGKKPLLDTETRVALLRDVADELGDGSTVEVVTFSGLVIDAAREAGACALVRGIRDGSDFDYELRLALMNRAMAPELDTLFLAASPNVGFISSTLVKQIASMNGDVSPFVPPATVSAIANAIGQTDR